MKHMKISRFALVGLLGLVMSAPLAHAQLHLVAQNATTSAILVTPADPATLAVTESPVFELEIPPIPSSGYVQFTSTSLWELDYTDQAPLRANFSLLFNVASPVLPPNTTLQFSVPFTYGGNPNGGAGGWHGATTGVSKVFTRKILAGALVGDDSLTDVTRKLIIDLLFQQGFHVSVSARLKSLNVLDAGVLNSNVAFFAEQSGNGNSQQ